MYFGIVNIIEMNIILLSDRVSFGPILTLIEGFFEYYAIKGFVILGMSQ